MTLSSERVEQSCKQDFDFGLRVAVEAVDNLLNRIKPQTAQSPSLNPKL